MNQHPMKNFILTIVILILTAYANCQESVLDLNFNSTGKFSADFGSRDYLFCNAVSNDSQRLISAGAAFNDALNSQLLIICLNEDGSLDSSFDLDGVLILTNYHVSIAEKCHIADNGKITVVGYMADSTGQTNTLALRLNPDGSFDSDFGSNGIKILENRASNDYGLGMVVHEDGKITIAGISEDASENHIPTLTRLMSNGEVDLSFGENGIVQIEQALGNSSLCDIQMDNAGRLVVCGYFDTGGDNFDCLVARFDQGGILDTSFANQGIFTIPNESTSETYQGLEISASNEYFFCGNRSYLFSDNDGIVVGLNENGSILNSFANDGIFTFNIDQQEYFYDIAMSQSGSLLIAGTSKEDNGIYGDYMLVSSIHLDGSINEDFNPNGYLLISVLENANEAFSISVQSDGNILLAGRSIANELSDASIVRLTDYVDNRVEEKTNINYSIYPNPLSAGTRLFIESTIGQTVEKIDLKNQFGQSVLTDKIVDPSSSIQIPDNLPCGIYVMILHLREGVYEQVKIVIET